MSAVCPSDSTDDASGGDVAPLVGAEVDGQRGKKSAMFFLRRNPRIDDVVLPKTKMGEEY